MPELPEVETTRLGIEPLVQHQTISSVVVRQARLRQTVPVSLQTELPGQSIISTTRRGKYLLLNVDSGCIIIHLGMSGSLRYLPSEVPPAKHDHVDIVFTTGCCIRFNDPRRFGLILWTQDQPLSHPLLRSLGPEPLLDDFNADYLYGQARGRKVAVKTFLMNSRIVVGVGNIYANEALFMAGIRPTIAAGRISKPRYALLVATVKQVLSAAIKVGGTTLRDFTASDGQPGYFAQQLKVYGKKKGLCPRCGHTIRLVILGQRATYYCAKCQH